MRDINDYNFVGMADDYDYQVDKIIALNKKHTLEEFQKEINRLREEMWDLRDKNLYDENDYSYIVEHISKDFDWFEINYIGEVAY